MSAAPRRGIGGLQRSASLRRLRSLLPDPVVDTLRSAVRVYGSTTAARRSMPDFLVIGAKKGARPR